MDPFRAFPRRHFRRCNIPLQGQTNQNLRLHETFRDSRMRQTMPSGGNLIIKRSITTACSGHDAITHGSEQVHVVDDLYLMSTRGQKFQRLERPYLNVDGTYKHKAKRYANASFRYT